MTALGAPTTAGKPLVGAALTRVSRGKGRDRERSPEQQLEAAREVTAIDGRPVVLADDAVYEERQSASRFGTRPRKRFAALVDDIRQGRYGLVIMWEVDRGARELEAWAGFLNVCREHAVLIHVITHHRTYDVRVGRDWRALADDGTDAAYFSEKLSVNVRRGHADSADRGRPPGRAPYGYTRVYDATTGVLAVRDGLWQQVPNEDAPVVKEIITRVGKHVPLNEIQRDLAARGVMLHRTKIRAIAMNPAYASLRPAGEGTVPGKWVPIVSETLWRKAKAVLDAQSTAGSVPGRTVWLLSLIGGCASCGAERSWKGLQARSGNRKPTYFCKQCGVKVGAEAAEECITDAMFARLSQQDAHRVFIHNNSEEAETARLELAQLEEKLERLRGRLEAATNADDEDEYTEQIRRLKPKIKAAKSRRERLNTPPALADLADALGDEKKLRAKWAKMTLTAKKEALRVLFKRINIRRADYRRQPIEERLDVSLSG